MKTLIEIANIIKYVLAVIVLSVITIGVKAQSTPAKTGYAPVNGLKMYYEIHGKGRPLVLLHGAFMTIGLNYGQLIPELSKDRQVIAFEFQGHGHTADIDRAYSHDAFADDVAAAIKYLKIDSADVYGYSLGGEVAMALAIRHPEVVCKLIVASAVSKFEGWAASTRAVFPMITPEMFAPTPIKTEYDKVAPNPKNFNQFITRMRDWAAKPFDLGSENIKAIKSPTLFIFGDSDGVEPSHIVELFTLRNGWTNGDMTGPSKSQLTIFPGTSHTGIVMQNDLLVKTMSPFLGK